MEIHTVSSRALSVDVPAHIEIAQPIFRDDAIKRQAEIPISRFFASREWILQQETSRLIALIDHRMMT